MSTVPRSSYVEFPIRRIFVRKAINRRLGFESNTPPKGWKWDYRYLVEDRKTETLPFPGLKKEHLRLVPKEYWQNGPTTGKRGDSLKVLEIKEEYINGQQRWVPYIHRGDVTIGRNSAYLFSDDSVVETLSSTNTDSAGRSRHTLQKPLRTSSPIEVGIYKREVTGEITPWRKYKLRYSFTGTLDSSNNQKTTRSGDSIYWSNVDTTKREFLTFLRNDYIELVFNQFVPETISNTVPSVLDDFNLLEYVGSSDYTSGQKFYSKYFPISNDSDFHIYAVDSDASTWTEYSIVSSFTGDNQVKVDYDLGIFTFGTVGSSNPPAKGEGIYISYNAVPRIEYEEEGFRDTFTARNADVNPINQGINKGFITLSQARLDINKISLSTTKDLHPTYSDSYGPIYIGADYAPLIAEVTSSSNELVPNAEVTFYFYSSSFGTIGGASTQLSKITNYLGLAKTFYVPPTSVNSVGYYVTSLTGTNSLTLDSTAEFTTDDDIYTYYVLKDDPLVGKVGADTSIGEVEWSPSSLNGRKVVMYKWDPQAFNPITGYLGAYNRVKPSSISDGNILTYPDALDTPDSSSSSTNLGAYWVVSDRYIYIRASTYSPSQGRTIYSNILKLRVEIPQYMKGTYISDSLNEIPFGWRLTDENYEVASAVAGATFISINPVAGPYPIIDVIGQETWDPYHGFWPYGAYPGEGATAPFGFLSLFFTIL